MITVCERNQCAGCMACIAACPRNAIRIEDTLDAYNAVIETSACVSCNACRDVCQHNRDAGRREPLSWYQGWAKDERIRRNSASGGVGVSLLRTFPEKHGGVCACVFRDGEFRFEFSDSGEEAEKYAGSKYVKSNPVGIYKGVRERLERGEAVLFIGLPCQVAAIRNFVGKRLEKRLYTVDLICHGSPSPGLLELYLRGRQCRLKEVGNLSFRRKNHFRLDCGGGSAPDPAGDLYTAAFLRGLDYTENCYRCKYAQLRRTADLTIGDSWGSQLSPEERRKGISLILCQTPKGERLLQEANLHLEEVDLRRAKRANHQLSAPVPVPRQRAKFFRALRGGAGFDRAAASCMPRAYYRERVKRILRKWKGTL